MMSNFPESFVAKGDLKFFTLFLSQNDDVIGSKRIERFFHRFSSHHRIVMVFNWVLKFRFNLIFNPSKFQPPTHFQVFDKYFNSDQESLAKIKKESLTYY